MSPRARAFVLWAPRMLAVVFAGFLAVFALDVFGMPGGFFQKLEALILHLVPSLLVLLALLLSWRFTWVGGVLFPLLAAAYLRLAWGRFPWSVYALIAGPLVLIGLLFWVSWAVRADRRARVA